MFYPLTFLFYSYTSKTILLLLLLLEIALGSSHCVAVGRGGDCFVWGDGDAGQLGLGNLDNNKQIAINNSFPPIKQVSAGSNHTTVVTMTGGVYTWGHCANGRLGIGDTERVGIPDHQKFFFPVPSCLSTLETIRQISCGTDHTLAIGLSGLWVWGSGAGGKLGLGDNLDRTSPVLIPVMKAKSIMQVSAGYWHSMAGGT